MKIKVYLFENGHKIQFVTDKCNRTNSKIHFSAMNAFMSKAIKYRPIE